MARELTRKQVAYRLGCSIASVQRLEQEGRIKPRRVKTEFGSRERVWFDPNDVARLAETWKPRRTQPERVDSELLASNVRGQVAAIVFRILDANPRATMSQIVQATSADPLLIRQLHREWKTGFDEGERLAEQKRAEAAEREAQRAHDRNENQRAYREMKLQVAKLEAKKREMNSR